MSSINAGDAQNLDVEKIATSDDLINILEDDYRNESSYAEKAHEIEYSSNENEHEHEHEHLNDAQHTDVNDYLKSIVSIIYEESYENYINCMVSANKTFSFRPFWSARQPNRSVTIYLSKFQLCPEEIISQQHLIYHINESHSQGDEVLCVFDENCPPFEDLVKVQEHIFHEHSDLIPWVWSDILIQSFRVKS